MVIEINGKEYELEFGLGFQEYLDINDPFKVNLGQGLSVDMDAVGFEKAVMGLSTLNPRFIIRVLKASLSEAKSKPRRGEVEEFVKELILESKEDGISVTEFVEELVENIKKDTFSQFRLEQLG